MNCQRKADEEPGNSSSTPPVESDINSLRPPSSTAQSTTPPAPAPSYQDIVARAPTTAPVLARTITAPTHAHSGFEQLPPNFTRPTTPGNHALSTGILLGVGPALTRDADIADIQQTITGILARANVSHHSIQHNITAKGKSQFKVILLTRVGAERAVVLLHQRPCSPNIQQQFFVTYWLGPPQECSDSSVGVFSASTATKLSKSSCRAPRTLAELQEEAAQESKRQTAGKRERIAQAALQEQPLTQPRFLRMASPELKIDSEQSLHEPSLYLQAEEQFVTAPAAELGMQLSAGCRVLLDSLDQLVIDKNHSLLSEKYRVELLPKVILPSTDTCSTSSPTYRLDWLNWQLRLRFSPVAWFHGVAKPSAFQSREKSSAGSSPNTAMEQAMAEARTWTQRVREVENTVPLWMTTQEDTEQPEWTSRPPEKCNALLSRKDASERECKFNVNSSHSLASQNEELEAVLMRGVTDEVLASHRYNADAEPHEFKPVPPYLLEVRPEATRDLILAPELHSTNRKMATSPDFWWRCVETCRTLARQWGYPAAPGSSAEDGFPVCGIALNFGKWETAEATDPLAKDCHAHAHIFLTPGAYRRNKEAGDGYLHRPLKGRYHAFEDYLLQDCKELEQDVLLSWDSKDHRSRVVETERKLTEITELLRGQQEQLQAQQAQLTRMETMLQMIATPSANAHPL